MKSKLHVESTLIPNSKLNANPNSDKNLNPNNECNSPNLDP